MTQKAIKDKAGRNLGSRAQKTRQRFLDATAKLLAERSILDISVTEIAREVDCVSSLFYHYFKDVEDVAQQLAREASKEVPAMVQLIDGSWEQCHTVCCVRACDFVVPVFLSFCHGAVVVVDLSFFEI